jgi:hypothetical protein
MAYYIPSTLANVIGYLLPALCSPFGPFWLLVRGQFILIIYFAAAIALCYIYVVVVVYVCVVAPCSRKLRCVVNSWYHRVVTSRSLLFQSGG